MKIYPITMIVTIMMCLMIYSVVEISESELTYAIDNTSNIVQSIDDFSASELGKNSARFLVDVESNTIKEIYYYITDKVGSSKATYGTNLIIGEFGNMFGLGNSFESIIDNCAEAIKSKV